MKAVLRTIAVVLLLVAAGGTRVAVCEIVNGSFEDDGYVSDLASSEPNGWSANVPTGKFAAYVYTDWPTDGVYNLTIHSQYADFDAGDAAMVSQDLILSDVREMVFDVKARGARSLWDPNLFSAVVLP